MFTSSEKVAATHASGSGAVQVSDGYGTETGEIGGVAAAVTRHVTPINDLADRIGGSAVGSTDFGAPFAEQAGAYGTAVHDKVVAALRAYATATSTLGDRLSDAHRQYATDDSLSTAKVGEARA